MKKTSRIITSLLAVTMLLGMLTACKKDNTTPNNTAANTGTVSTAPGTDQSDEALLCKPEEKKFGYTYTILTDSNGDTELPFYVNTENKPSGEVIANALYMRQQTMKDLYDVTLNINVDKDYQNTMVNTGAVSEYVCDVTMLPAADLFSFAIRGYYCNLLNLQDFFHLEASYWDQRIQKEYRINDMLFTLDGDFTYIDELRTLVVLYNERLYEDLGYKVKYGTPYSMVENHTWTYETMMQMIKGLAQDTYEDDIMNENDTWGMVSELTAPYYFFLGAGMKTMENDNGELKLLLKDTAQYERIYNVIEKTMTIVNDKDVLVANGGAISSKNVWTAASDVFEQNRALFRTTTLSAVTRLGNMEANYGILPIPAYFADQTEYYCWTSGNSNTPLAISAFVPSADTTAEITERLCYHSRYGTDTLYSAFFDQMAYSRICRSADDIRMLELVIASKTYDIDQVTKITGVEPALYSLAKAKNFTVISSTLSGLVSSSSTNLDKYLIDMISHQIR